MGGGRGWGVRTGVCVWVCEREKVVGVNKC